MDDHPNLYVDIDARISELGRAPYSARKFFIKYQDRILFGTDTTPRRDAFRIYYRFLETDDEYFDRARQPSPAGLLANLRYISSRRRIGEDLREKCRTRAACPNTAGQSRAGGSRESFGPGSSASGDRSRIESRTNRRLQYLRGRQRRGMEQGGLDAARATRESGHRLRVSVQGAVLGKRVVRADGRGGQQVDRNHAGRFSRSLERGLL